jgi:hypothetical protein
VHATIDRDRARQQLATVVDRNQFWGVHANLSSRRNGKGFAAERSEVLGMIARNAQHQVGTKRIMRVENSILGQL